MKARFARDLGALPIGQETPSPADPELLSVLRGLAADPPHVSPRWFYDALGSALFTAITQLPEYYPTRTELGIFAHSGAAMAQMLGPGLTIVELGSGSGEKIGNLLRHLATPRAYHPIDISRAALQETERAVRAAHPSLEVEGLVGDFTSPTSLDRLCAPLASRAPLLVFFPGGTLGNFHPSEATALLAAVSRRLPAGTALLLGVDQVKPPHLIEAAYDDSVGLTAAFNRNLLAHLNRRFGSDFDPRAWRHVARYDQTLRRVEMWLVSERNQVVSFGGEQLRFTAGARIHTENSYKYDRERLHAVATPAGFQLEATWTDPQGWFCEALLRASARGVRTHGEAARAAARAG